MIVCGLSEGRGIASVSKAEVHPGVPEHNIELDVFTVHIGSFLSISSRNNVDDEGYYDLGTLNGLRNMYLCRGM